jgi:hypothetical protein
MLVVLICVPTMLFVKPCYLDHVNKRHALLHKLEEEECDDNTGARNLEDCDVPVNPSINRPHVPYK